MITKLDNIIGILGTIQKGGKGSGDFGHSGREGVVGGSSPKGIKERYELTKGRKYERLVEKEGVAHPKSLVDATNAVLSQVDKDCKPALQLYTANGDYNYKFINNQLRDPPPSKKADFYINLIDKAIDKSNVPVDIIVSRHIGYHSFLGEGEPSDLIGKVFRDKAYVSTTLLPKLEVFESQSFIDMKIRVPAGSKGLYVGRISNQEMEYEMLLPRNSEFVIEKVKDNEDGKREIIMALLPH